MPPGEKFRDERLAVRLQSVREALHLTAKAHSGEVLLVPGAGTLADAIGRTTGYFYGPGSGRPADTFAHLLESATGLSVIHKGGLVLAGEVDEAYGENFTPDEIQKLAEQLSPKQIAELIGNLSLILASNNEL